MDSSNQCSRPWACRKDKLDTQDLVSSLGIHFLLRTVLFGVFFMSHYRKSFALGMHCPIRFVVVVFKILPLPQVRKVVIIHQTENTGTQKDKVILLKGTKQLRI